MDFKQFKKLIMVEQTLFALPFAYIGMLFAGKGSPLEWLWIGLALFGARTAGMSFNRILDADIDRKNSRTEDRLIPKGEVSKKDVWILAIASSVLLIGSSYMLNILCFYLSFAAIFLLFTYSFFKRFSSTSHFYLGAVEAAAPIGGYLAISGELKFIALMPGAIILFWIAALDIIYSIQDMDFDKNEGLFSIPSKFGKNSAITFASLSYLTSIILFVITGVIEGFSTPYWLAVIIVSLLFILQINIAREKYNNLQEGIIEIFYLNRFISPIILIGLILQKI